MKKIYYVPKTAPKDVYHGSSFYLLYKSLKTRYKSGVNNRFSDKGLDETMRLTRGLDFEGYPDMPERYNIEDVKRGLKGRGLLRILNEEEI